MGCESSDVVRFDFGPLLQGQMMIGKLKSVCNSLIIGPIVVVGPVLKIKTGFRSFETERNPGFRKFTEI